MIIEVLTWLTRLVEGTPGIAIVGSLLWGVLSIILSPCHLASIPLIIGYINEQGQIPIRRAFVISLVFSSGILITIALVGFVTALAGRMIGDLGVVGNYGVAVIFFIIGLHLLGIIPLSWSGGGMSTQKKGMIGAFIIGLLFGFALGPCTFAYMAPMLAIVFKVASTRLLFALTLFLFFGAGHCSVIVIAGTLTGSVSHYLHWSERSKGVSIIKKICGLLVMLGGFYLLISA